MKNKTYQDAIYETIEEIVAILNYQPDIPIQHKKDLAAKFSLLQKAKENYNMPQVKGNWNQEGYSG